LVRTEARRVEFAMRLALGGTRVALANDVMLEGALLTAAGCVFSWPIGVFLLKTVQTFELPGRLVLSQLDLSLDQSALTASIVAALLSVAAITSLAVVFSLTATIEDVRHARTGATPRVRRRHTRAALVVAQVAVAMVLLCGAGLFAQS